MAVNNIDFNVPPGEIFGFLGPNDAGKTTTINILCTLSKSTSRQAVIKGFDVVRQQNQVRQSIELIFRDPSLEERLSGTQNLRFHALVYNVPASIISVKTADDTRAAEEIKLGYGVETRQDSDGLTFEVDNGGEFIPPFV